MIVVKKRKEKLSIAKNEGSLRVGNIALISDRLDI